MTATMENWTSVRRYVVQKVVAVPTFSPLEGRIVPGQFREQLLRGDPHASQVFGALGTDAAEF